MGYPKGTKGYLFYDPNEQMVLVSTNTHFLEEDYMIDNKPKSKVILDELRAETNEGNEVPIPVTQVSTPLVVRTQEPMCLVVVGGLLHNQSVLLVWDKFQ